MYVCAESCLTLCNSMDCSPPGSSVHGILQARILEWVAISFSREFSWPRDRTSISCVSRLILYYCVTWEGYVYSSNHSNIQLAITITFSYHLCRIRFRTLQPHVFIPMPSPVLPMSCCSSSSIDSSHKIIAFFSLTFIMKFPGGSAVQNPPTNARDTGSILGSGRSPWKRKWQPSPVFLLGKSHGWRSLVGYSPWGGKESDRT